MPTPEEILTDLNTNILPAVADLTNSVQTAITAMNALKDKAAVQTDKGDELFALTPADVTMPNGDIVPNFAKVRDDLQTAITAFTSVVYLEATATAVDSAKLEGKTLLEISSNIKADIIDGAPAIYDTLLEISNALGDDDTAINGLLTQLSALSTSLTDLANAVADKAPAVHEHDDRYYTKSQTDTAIGNATSKPTFTTDAVTNISGTAVTLNGTISDFVDASTSLQYRFIYGSTTAMEEGATTWTTVSSIGAVSASATVALLTTTYYVLMQIRDTNKPDSMGILPIPADWATERTSFLSGSEILDSDSYIYLQGTGGTGYSAIDGTTVPNITNGSIVSNEVVLTGTGKAITYSINQDVDEGDFSSITPSFKVRPYKFTINGSTTATTWGLNTATTGLLTNGSKVIATVGGVDAEYTLGSVSYGGGQYTCTSITPTPAAIPTNIYTDTNSTAIYASATAGAGNVFNIGSATTTSSVVLGHNTSGLLANGDVVSMNSGTGGANQNVAFASVSESSTTAQTLSSTFSCNYDYFTQFHKQNWAKDTTVSDITGWTTGTSLPGALAYSQAIVTKSRVYLLGGYNGGSASTVYTAPINSDGTLGAWTTGTSLPGGLAFSQAIVTKSRVYLLGGDNGSGPVSIVYTAPFTDGWGVDDNNWQGFGTSYTCTSPTPALVQIPTTAVKGEKVIPALSGFTRATDTITYNYVKTPLPAGTRSVAQEVSGGIGDVISTIGNTELYTS